MLSSILSAPSTEQLWSMHPLRLAQQYLVMVPPAGSLQWFQLISSLGTQHPQAQDLPTGPVCKPRANPTAAQAGDTQPMGVSEGWQGHGARCPHGEVPCVGTMHQMCQKQEEVQGFLCPSASHMGRQVCSHVKVLWSI